MRATYYRHSGRFSVPGAVLGLAGGAATGAILALVYAYALAYIPIVGYVTFILSLGFGGIVGFVTGRLLRSAHVRNTAVTLTISAVVALVAFYVSWVSWIAAVAGRADADLPIAEILFRPDLVWELVKGINEVGAWSLKSWTPTGTVLWVLWTLEAGLIVVPIFVMTSVLVGSLPYCESCGKWCEESEGVLHVAYAEPAELRQRLETGDVGYLAALGRAEPGARTWIRIDLHRCPTASCARTNTLTAQVVSVTVNDKGEQSMKANAVVDKMLVERPTVEQIQEIAQRVQAA
jgi:hypothetical protein